MTRNKNWHPSMGVAPSRDEIVPLFICDTRSCPAKASVRVILGTGDLDFCAHHFHKYEEQMLGRVLTLVEVQIWSGIPVGAS